MSAATGLYISDYTRPCVARLRDSTHQFRSALGCHLRRAVGRFVLGNSQGKPLGRPACISRMGMGTRTLATDSRAFHGRHADRTRRLVSSSATAQMGMGTRHFHCMFLPASRTQRNDRRIYFEPQYKYTATDPVVFSLKSVFHAYADIRNPIRILLQQAPKPYIFMAYTLWTS